MKAKKWLKKGCSMLLSLCLAIGLVSEYVPIVSKAERKYKELTFSDFGLADGTYTTDKAGNAADTTITSLDGVAFTGNISLDAEGAEVRIGGITGGWVTPIMISLSNGQLWSWDGLGTGHGILLTNVQAGTSFKLRVEFDYAGSDVTAKFYVNDMENVLATHTYTGYAEKLAPTILVYATADKNATISSSDNGAEDKTYKELTFSDFGLADGTYTAYKTGNSSDTTLTSLDGVAFTGNISLDTEGAEVRIGGNDGEGWVTPIMISLSNGQLWSWDGLGTGHGILLTNVQAGTSFKLRVEFDYAGSDITAKFYVNDMENMLATHTYTGYAAKLAPRILVYATADKNVTISSSGSGDEEDKTGYKELTFADMGIKDDTYTATVTGTPADPAITTLDGVAITGNMAFGAERTADIRIGGISGGWETPIMIMISDGQLWSWDGMGTGHGVSLTDMQVGMNFKLRVEIRYEGEDVKVKFYVNDMDNAVQTHVYTGYASKLAPGMLVYAGDVSPVVIGTGNIPIVPEEPLEQKTPEQLGYTQIRLPDFEMSDGEYAPGQVKEDHRFELCKDQDSVSGKYFDVNIAFKGTDLRKNGASLRYATINGWEGIQIAVEEGELWVFNASVGGGYHYTLEELGLGSFSEKFNLKLGVKVGEGYEEGSFDVTFCLWINNTLIEKDAKLAKVKGIGSGLGIHTASATIVLESPASADTEEEAVVKEQLPADFRKITFESFEIQDGTYRCIGDLNAKGQWVLPMDDTIFSADVFFSAEQGGELRYGGVQNAWCGLYFYSSSDGKIYMDGVVVGTEDNPTGLLFHPSYCFKPFTAGTKLTDTWINMKISTQIVDSDGDGKKDDVKLGVWFNDVLYDNQYIYLQDYAKNLGSYLGVCVSREEGYIQIKSDDTVNTGVDYTLFGFTKNWKRETGLVK